MKTIAAFYAKGVSASGGDFGKVFPATIQGYDERDPVQRDFCGTFLFQKKSADT
jgi:hypothetical protein